MTTANAAAPSPERIMQLAWGYVPPLLLEAAIRHRIFDSLADGPLPAAEIQKRTGVSARGLAPVLNALVGLDFLGKGDEGAFSLTPESAAFLVSARPGFQGGLIRHCSEHLIPRWLGLNQVVATGKPVEAVNQQDSGAEFFREFVNDIFPLSYPAAQALAAALGLASASTPVRVLDLATGSGVWGIALAQASPRVQVTAVDWPGVLPVTRQNAARFGLADRFTFVEGDLQQADFGTGYDVATLGHILHSEGPVRSRALLSKVYDALAPGGTIAIAEFLVNADRTGPVNGLFFALNMLVNTEEGDTYSFEEISAWLRGAGFSEMRTLDAPGPSPLILATRV
jgi:ubiquinone/menaquinone biosynthesis C-methylase UbiE